MPNQTSTPVEQVEVPVITSSLGFTNTSSDGPVVSLPNIAIQDNYGTVRNEATEVRLKNSTGPVDQKEIITFRAREIKSINTYNKIYYPARVQEGVEFGIRLDEVLRTQDSNGFIICDEPIVLSVAFKAPLSSNITEEILDEIFKRLYDAAYVGGQPHWLTIMGGSLNPLIK